MLAVAPRLAVGGIDLGGCLFERRNAGCLAPLEHGIEAHLDPGANLTRPLSGTSKADLGGAAEPDVSSAAIFLNAAHPALRAVGADDQVEAVTIAQAARPLRRFDACREELSHGIVFPHLFPHA